jgi:hypothetical protein
MRSTCKRGGAVKPPFYASHLPWLFILRWNWTRLAVDVPRACSRRVLPPLGDSGGLLSEDEKIAVATPAAGGAGKEPTRIGDTTAVVLHQVRPAPSRAGGGCGPEELESHVAQ